MGNHHCKGICFTSQSPCSIQFVRLLTLVRRCLIMGSTKDGLPDIAPANGRSWKRLRPHKAQLLGSHPAFPNSRVRWRDPFTLLLCQYNDHVASHRRPKCVTDAIVWVGDSSIVAWLWVGFYDFDDTLLARYTWAEF